MGAMVAKPVVMQAAVAVQVEGEASMGAEREEATLVAVGRRHSPKAVGLPRSRPQPVSGT